MLSDKQKHICEQVVNVFGSGLAGGKYEAVVTNDDGPHQVRQISYGRSPTTEYGKLEELLTMYVNSDGQYSDVIRPYLPKIGVTPLAEDEMFKRLLKNAGTKDPVMQRVQDHFFDWCYFQPAIRWMEDNGFVLPLSALIIYDSFIQSGSILKFLRKRFPENVPNNGGHEKAWISQYVDIRHSWLTSHSNELLRNSAFRTICFKNEIARNNWTLNSLPVIAQDVEVFG